MLDTGYSGHCNFPFSKSSGYHYKIIYIQTGSSADLRGRRKAGKVKQDVLNKIFQGVLGWKSFLLKQGVTNILRI